jgi:CBS domain-containing protein
MGTTTKTFATMTARDLMTRNVVTIPQEMAMRDAAQLLLQLQISGAPVVDEGCRCVGILSATDFLQRAGRTDNAAPSSPALPLTCGFQENHWDSAGREVICCKLPSGVCSIQRSGKGPGGEARTICSEPHTVPTDWQVVNVERVPTDPVRRYMTTDLATAEPETRIGDLARRMIDGHIHRLVVVDNQLRPVGIVSSTDILAAVAYAERACEGGSTQSRSCNARLPDVCPPEPDIDTLYAEFGVGD